MSRDDERPDERARVLAAYRLLRRGRFPLPASAAWRVAKGLPSVEMTDAELDAIADRIARQERIGPYTPGMRT